MPALERKYMCVVKNFIRLFIYEEINYLLQDDKENQSLNQIRNILISLFISNLTQLGDLLLREFLFTEKCVLSLSK